MRRLTTIVIAVSLLTLCIVPWATAGEKKEAGEIIGDSMYVDNKFGFSFVRPDGWKFQDVFKNKDIERVVLIQKSPVLPPQFDRDKKRFFTQPQVTILGMETDKSAKEYAEFLIADDGKDDLKSKARGRFQLLRQDSEYVFQKRRISFTKVGGQHARKIIGRKEYFYAFGEQRDEDDPIDATEKGEVLSGFIRGYIYVIGAENGLLLMEFVAEREMLESLEPDLDLILDSFAFAGEESDAEEEPEPAEEPQKDD
jgi:hypothetical protein